jgi:hypothetical protein
MGRVLGDQVPVDLVKERDLDERAVALVLGVVRVVLGAVRVGRVIPDVAATGPEFQVNFGLTLDAAGLPVGWPEA